MSSSTQAPRSRGLAITFGVANLIAAAVIAVGVFAGLPSRYWLVDGGAAILIVAMGAAGVGLLARLPWAPLVARSASLLSLVLGLALIASLAFSVSFLLGVYGPVGKGGVILFVLIIALVFPYLVLLPAAQLVWLGPREASSAS
jgi:hypothetical protein